MAQTLQNCGLGFGVLGFDLGVRGWRLECLGIFRVVGLGLVVCIVGFCEYIYKRFVVCTGFRSWFLQLLGVCLLCFGLGFLGSSWSCGLARLVPSAKLSL